MENRTISLRQMLTVVFLALFPLGTETLFQPLAGARAAGWLCPLLAGGIAVGLAWVVGHRERIHSIKDMGRWLALLLLLWGLFFGAAQACRIGMRLADPLGASPVLMTVALLALAVYMFLRQMKRQ